MNNVLDSYECKNNFHYIYEIATLHKQMDGFIVKSFMIVKTHPLGGGRFE